MKKYAQHVPDDTGWTEWIHPIRGDEEPATGFYRLCCCQCGLVHDLDFREHPAGFLFRARRNSRATGQVRRHMRKLDNA
jgi:hypothetical protein